MNEKDIARSRRHFLQASIAGLAAAQAERSSGASVSELPRVKFGQVEVTKLIIGSNPLYGGSHFNGLFSGLMSEWMTQDKRMEILHRCEKAGINTWQAHYIEGVTMEDLKRYRGEGGRMNFLLLGMGRVMTDYKSIAQVAKVEPIGIAHHGNVADDLFREGHKEKIKDWCKAARDAGVTVGLSTHNPTLVATAEDESWDIDYYMTCMYWVSRTPEQARAEYGEAPVGEIYMERDPERMLKMVRQTKKTCFAFKVLGAGRRIRNAEEVDSAFRFVLERIKPQDAIIVGMFPKFQDQVSDNVARVKRLMAQIGS
jgi:hypothetical protein